jgi:hypothetical protein
MTEKTKQVEVTASEGRHICRYGSRKCGEQFTLPATMARELVEQQPDAFKIVKAEETVEEVEENAD